jgi:PIN domain nuclease of toxin-antitoxin system
MKGLLDTHTFMWWTGNQAKLSAIALAFIQDPANTVLLSVVSVWEIIIKQQLGKLTLTAPLANVVQQQQANGIQILPATLDHVLAVQSLPMLHKDPFDRLLIAQANVEGATVLSADLIFLHYPVPVLW